MNAKELRELADIKDVFETLQNMRVTVINCDGDSVFMRLDGDRMVHIKIEVGSGDMGDPALAVTVSDWVTSPITITQLRKEEKG